MTATSLTPCFDLVKAIGNDGEKYAEANVNLLKEHAAATVNAKVVFQNAKRIVLHSARVVYVFPSHFDDKKTIMAHFCKEKEDDNETDCMSYNSEARLSFTTCPGLLVKVFSFYEELLTMRQLELSIFNQLSAKNASKTDFTLHTLTHNIENIKSILDRFQRERGHLRYVNHLFNSDDDIEKMRVDIILQLDSGFGDARWLQLHVTMSQLAKSHSQLPPNAKPDFIQSDFYLGRQNYLVFRKGKRGIGYYKLGAVLSDDDVDCIDEKANDLFGDDYDQLVLRRVAGAHRGDMYWRESI